MSLPGFSAERAIGGISAYRSDRRFNASAPGVSPAAARWHTPAEWFWPCFRNCYDRCGGSGDYHVELCHSFCYTICDTTPWVVF
jgi:hypothetical protein